MSNSVSQAIVKLFDTERFYAEVLAQMRRISSTRVPLAGVCIKDQVELIINTEEFAKLSLETRVAVLKHECEHIMRNHIPRSKEISPESFVNKKDAKIEEDIVHSMKRKALNIAADCAINGLMPDLPDWGVFPKSFDLPNGETLEWYLDNLKDNEKAKDFMNVDDHSVWGESEGQKEALAEKIRQMVNSAAKKTRAAGKMTSEDELLVSKLNASVVDWRSQLRRFAARNNLSIRESSRKKRNRRYGLAVPGDVKTDRLVVGVAVDTSGSVSDEALVQFMSEIDRIAAYADVVVVEADAEIKNTYVYKKGQKLSLKGRGGTAYQPAFDYFNDLKTIDAVIYFGDMDTSDDVTKPKYPVMWAIVGEQDPPADFGTIVRVVLNDRN